MLMKGADSSRTMIVRRYYPEPLFQNERMEYPESEVSTEGGLCWLVEDRLKRTRWGQELPVVYIPDTTKENAYRRGHHHFGSIMLAPVPRWGTTELLGVVCLDAERVDHYVVTDKRFISLVAMTLSAVWAGRGVPN